jgi:hypothetical protein
MRASTPASDWFAIASTGPVRSTRHSTSPNQPATPRGLTSNAARVAVRAVPTAVSAARHCRVTAR